MRLDRWIRLLPPLVVAIVGGYAFAHVAMYRHEPAALVIWPLCVLITARWPVAGIFAAGAALRLGYADFCCTDQIVVSQAAWDRVVSGGDGPYGVGYPQTTPPNSPFPYGPLAMVWWVPGPLVELGATVGIMVVLAWQRALVTLARFAVWPSWRT